MPWLAPFQPLDIVAGLALGLCVLEVMQGVLTVPKRLPHLWLMLGLFGGVLMSHIANTYLAGLTAAFEDFGKTVLVFLLIILTANSTKRLRIMTGIVVAMALFMALHCVIQVRTGVGFGGIPPLVINAGRPDEHLRAEFVGIFGDPNDTSLFLVAAMPLALALIPWCGLVRRMGSTCALVLLVLGLYSTESRGGYLAFGVMLLTFFRQFIPVRVFAFAAVAGAVLLITLAPARLVKIGFLDESATDRVVFWGYANQEFKRNPVFGVGHGAITEYVPEDRALHNSYVQAYADLGVFGYVFWLGLLAMGLIGCWQVGELMPETEEERQLVRMARFMVPALCGLYAAAYFLSRTYHVPFFVLLALCAATYRLASDRVGIEKLNWFTGLRRERLWWWPAASLGSIGFIYCSILLVNRLK